MPDNNYKYDVRWFKGLSADETEKLKAQLAGDKKTLDKLYEIVYNIVRSEENVRFSDYDTPNWSYKQAHRFGRVDALQELLRLINLDPEVKP